MPCIRCFPHWTETVWSLDINWCRRFRVIHWVIIRPCTEFRMNCPVSVGLFNNWKGFFLWQVSCIIRTKWFPPSLVLLRSMSDDGNVIHRGSYVWRVWWWSIMYKTLEAIHQTSSCNYKPYTCGFMYLSNFIYHPLQNKQSKQQYHIFIL